MTEPTAPEGRVFTDLYCMAMHPDARKRADRYGQVHGYFIQRVNGLQLRFTGQVFRRAELLDYRSERVFVAARCPDCGMISEYEAVAPAAPAPRRKLRPDALQRVAARQPAGV